MEKRQKTALESGALILIVAGILVAVNALSAFGMYARKDVTKNEKYTLSKGSGNLLRSMKQDLKIEAYVTKNLPKLDAFVRDLRDLLQEYKTAGGGKMDYEIIEAKDEETKKKAKDAGLQELDFGDASETDEKVAVSKGFMGLVLRYGEQQVVIPALDPSQTTGLEFWLTNKIREVRDKGDNIKHKIGVLTGHDEIKLTEANLVPSQVGKYNMQGIITQNFPFYSFEDVDLKGGDQEISADLDGLIITQPNKDYTEKELRRIDQFLMKGKSLAVFASAVNVKANDASMNATLSTHGLEKLLEGYGIEVRKDAVLDFGRSFRVPLATQSGLVSYPLPQFIMVQDDSRFTGDETLLDTSFPPFFRLETVVVPLASSLDIHKDKQPEAKVIVTARSTPRSIAMTGDTVDLKPLQKWKQKGDWKQYGLSASVEGTLASAFPSGDKQGVEAPAKSEKPSRVFLVSSSQFLANPLARAGNGPDMGGQMGMMMPMGGDEELLKLSQSYAQLALTNTILVLKNTLDWMGGDTDLLAISAKITQDPSLAFGEVTKPNFDPNETEEQLRKHDEDMRAQRKVMQQKIQWTLTLGIPALFLLLGVVRWRARIASRENASLV
jgi:ABC-type uncharacterized transport system involved in gliding motility auxiliary subunit